MSGRTRTLTLLAIFSLCSLAWSAPVLVKLDFTSQKQADFAKHLGVMAYQRFDNSYIAEIESSRIFKVYGQLGSTAWAERSQRR
ncbi:MAG: hypothetical protein A2142_04750 [candidate division Zixibacteria bacterium RBG_16_48_11]|nr:MAG: hypothetical protein A2142_04750 [candidate division Zixibacteria bacterium RBG_16_48_11]